MKQYHLTGESFLLTLELKVFESDVRCPSNTLMTVTVESSGFRGTCVFDIDVKEFGRFARELERIYQTLRGKTEIREPFGYRQFLSFEGNGRGQISIEGDMRSDLHAMSHRLMFENTVDQTCLRDFAAELKTDFEGYTK